MVQFTHWSSAAFLEGFFKAILKRGVANPFLNYQANLGHLPRVISTCDTQTLHSSLDQVGSRKELLEPSGALVKQRSKSARYSLGRDCCLTETRQPAKGRLDNSSVTRGPVMAEIILSPFRPNVTRDILIDLVMSSRRTQSRSRDS